MASSRRKEILKAKKSRKEQAMNHPSGQSKYARKAEYLHGTGLMGFQVPEPKPWKS